LKEGCNINKSLSALGDVIKALVDKQNGKKCVVPYRNSALTRILQNALGGNSKTYMICAIRPGAKFFEETLSTLRYADRAKQIKNKAVVNEDPQDKLIRELKEENDKLKEMMASGKLPVKAAKVDGEESEDEEDMDAMKAQLEAN
jgi:kinesin family protein 1